MNHKIIYDYLLMFLMVLQPLLAFTIFNTQQILVELILILLLFGRVINIKLELIELILLIFFSFFQILSFLSNDLTTFLIGAKQFGLGILSLIYFNRYGVKKGKEVLFCLFVINLVITVFQYFDVFSIKEIYRPILNTFADFEETKPLGLFLNYHASSFFSAIFLIYYFRSRFLFFSDYLYLYIAGTGTSLVAYFMHRIYYYCISIKLFKELKLSHLVFLFLIITFIGVVAVNSFFVSIDYDASNIGSSGVSALVVVSQLSSLNFYNSFISFIPIDPTNYFVVDVYNHFTLQHHGGNEVQYLSTILQAGLPVGLLYIYMILKANKLYRVFILFAMLHYCYILLPLFIYIYSLGNIDDTTVKLIN